MQNKQSYLSELTKTVRDNYSRFFELNNSQVKQMPTFQLNLFIEKALVNNFPVIVQFNDQTPDTAGYLKQIAKGRFLITSADKRFHRLFSVSELQAIKKF